tara:strand:- start:2 stop:676 length:675 start_codon:yes stop_codon:yes gene_type:complete
MAYFTGPNIVTDGLVFAYDAASERCYPGSGTAATNITSQAIPGTLTNGVTFSTNNAGTWGFDGVDQYISTVSKSYSFSSGGTVEQFIKPTAINRTQGFFNLGDGNSYINFWMSANNLMRWEIIGNIGSAYATINATTAVEVGKYYHFVGVFDGSTTTIYVNGVAETTQTMSNQPSSVTTQLEIGRYNASYPSASEIAVTRFYSQPLTAAQVLQNFNAQKSRFGL